MVILQDKKTVIYPFEEPCALDESNEAFERRVSVGATISIDHYGKILCSFTCPSRALTDDELCDYAGKLNRAFDEAIVIAAETRLGLRGDSAT
jgi:hypothetical protein